MTAEILNTEVSTKLIGMAASLTSEDKIIKITSRRGDTGTSRRFQLQLTEMVFFLLFPP